METFGERLKEERKRLGMNQADFAVLGGVQRTAQINYEKDERSPDVAYLQKIATHGVDVLYVLIGTRNSDALDSEQNSVLNAYQNASPRVRAAALAALVADTPVTMTQQNFKGEVGQVIHGDVEIKSSSGFTFGINKSKQNK